ncbi:MAG: SPJ_0845 family protein [Lactobacillus sp.]
MGLTFKRQDDLDRMLEKFAVVPDPIKKKPSKKPADKSATDQHK